MDIEIDFETGDLAQVETSAGIDLAIVSGTDEILQSLWARFKIFLGEQYYVSGYGMPYFTDVFNTPALSNAINYAFSRVAANTPGVDKVESVDFDLDALDSSQKLDIEVSFTAVDNPENIAFPIVYDFSQGRTE